MEREIKFRAWDEGNKVMHYDFQWIQSGADGNDWIVFKSDKQTNFTEAVKNPFFQKQLKKMQFTGLKDKKGQEIYEGDIYKTWYSRDTSGKDIIKIIEAVSFDVETHKEKAGVEIMFLHNAEVIGNIFENSDLLTTRLPSGKTG